MYPGAQGTCKYLRFLGKFQVNGLTQDNQHNLKILFMSFNLLINCKLCNLMKHFFYFDSWKLFSSFTIHIKEIFVCSVS